MGHHWAEFKDEQLLQTRLCDLNLKIEGSGLEAGITQLFSELETKGLGIRPKIYLGDEWFSPEGVLAISIPFYLAHPRLVSLQKKFLLEAEGSDPSYFMKLLRHEAGHCFDHAFGFSKRRKWHRVFGSPDQDYSPEHYRPRKYSRSFVHNLSHWYAQSHPDEDFAETFAVWLSSDEDWKTKYEKWPALEKLLYVDCLAQEVAGKNPKQKSTYFPCQASKMKITLEKYYSTYRKEYAQNYPDFHDADLKKIFSGDASLSKREFSASRFLRKNRKSIVQAVNEWSTEKKYHINSLVKKLADRCEELNLRLGKAETQTSIEAAAYLSALVTHYLYTGRYKRRD